MAKIGAFFTKVRDVVINFIQKYWFWLSLALVVILAVVIRIPLMTKMSGDYHNFLKPWYQSLLEDAKGFLASDDADYTPTYLYFLAFLSLFKFDIEGQALNYSIKFISMGFELGTAILIFFILKFILKKHDAITLLGVFLALFLPQIFLNSAFWGQCDAIYVFFIVLSLFFVLKGKSAWASVAFAISFTFKLQSIFFLPVLILLWFKKKFKLYWLLLVPVIYVVMMIPAMACGRSFASCINVYFDQTEEYPFLSVNAPSMYIFMYKSQITNESVMDHLVPAATYFGLALIVILLIFLFLAYKDVTLDEIVKISFLLALFAPFVLPSMHERYFYLAEVFAILYVAVNPKKWYISFLAVAGTFQGYNNYLFNTYYLDNNNLNLIVGAISILAALILLIYDTFKGKTLGFPKKEAPQA